MDSLERQVEEEGLGRVVVPHYPLSSRGEQVGGVGSVGGPVHGLVVAKVVPVFLTCAEAEIIKTSQYLGYFNHTSHGKLTNY